MNYISIKLFKKKKKIEKLDHEGNLSIKKSQLTQLHGKFYQIVKKT